MRVLACLLFAAIAGCHPSATVEHTMPVANLQSYRTVALRVQSTAFAAQGQAMYLEQAVVKKLRERCGFENIVRPGVAPADVILDLNITNVQRGGGMLSNSSQARMDTLLVLSDGQNGDLLGTARIHGKSSGMIINNSVPETEAIDIVAKTVADVLAKSGCTGPRIARIEPPGQQTAGTGSAGSSTGSAAGSGTGSAADGTGSGSATGPSDAQRAQAEALNEHGKEKLRSADIAGALVAFQQANQLVPDPRYAYNICLALEAQEKFPEAIAACKQARSMNPEPRLVTKIDHRLELLANHQ